MSRRRDAIFTVASLLVAVAVARPVGAAQEAASGSARRQDGPAASSGSPAEPSGSPATPTGSPVPPSGRPAEGADSPAEPSGSAPELETSASNGTEAAALPSGPSAEASEVAVDASAPPGSASVPAARLRVAVVLVGDPNADARAAADAIESAVSVELELPADAALRASLLGSTGDETIGPVVRDRRALGGTEAEDLPLLVALGDRSDAALLLVVRRRAGRRELVGFDVRHGAFFDGSIDLDGAIDPARVRRFARARARATQAEPSAEETAELAASAERAAGGSPGRGSPAPSTGEREDEPEWIELNWPYLLAGALLAGAAAFVIVYTAEDGSQPVPTLRFRPGGTP